MLDYGFGQTFLSATLQKDVHAFIFSQHMRRRFMPDSAVELASLQ
jgi:hypothetical protein